MSPVQPVLPEDDDTPRAAAERSRAASRSTWVSVVVNTALSVAQIGTGVLAHSQGLVADGVHSLSDLVADFVVLIANRHSQRDPDDVHPYGYQRFETAASFVLGLLLVLVGIGMVASAAGKLQHPGAIATSGSLALWVAAVVLVAKESLFRYLMAVARRVRSGMLAANAWHARSDAASSLVVGLGIAGNMAGYPILDPVAALIVAFLVGRMGWGFAWAALTELMDRAAGEAEVAAIRHTILATPGVLDVHELRTRKMADMIVADAHIVVAADISVVEGHDIAVAARRRVLQQHRVLNLMTHIDPADQPDLDHQPAT